MPELRAAARPRRSLARRPALVEVTVDVEGLNPAHDGLRIAHLTDVHCGRLTPEPHIRQAVDLANAAEPDVIALTGDYVCWRRDEIRLMRHQLAGLSAREAVVATLGNHDYFTSGEDVVEALDANGYHVLRNESMPVMVRGARLDIVGVDDPVTRRDDVAKSFARVAADSTRVTLCHCPEAVDEIEKRGSAVVLSGHTHGGQIWLRGVTDCIFKKTGRRYRQGLYRVGASHLYVSAGVGFSGVTLRVGDGCQAEVALITLRAAA